MLIRIHSNSQAAQKANLPSRARASLRQLENYRFCMTPQLNPRVKLTDQPYCEGAPERSACGSRPNFRRLPSEWRFLQCSVRSLNSGKQRALSARERRSYQTRIIWPSLSNIILHRPIAPRAAALARGDLTICDQLRAQPGAARKNLGKIRAQYSSSILNGNAKKASIKILR